MDEEEARRILRWAVYTKPLRNNLYGEMPKRLTVQDWLTQHPASTYEDKKRPGFRSKE